MKEHTVLNVLIYLFKHQLHAHLKSDELLGQLCDELEAAGFKFSEIEQALIWLNTLEQHLSDSPKLCHRHSNALRVYSDYEINRISSEARGYLTELEQHKILDPHLREIIIHQALIFERELIDLSFLKWLTLMVLCNQAEQIEGPSSQKLRKLEDHSVGINVT